MKEKIVVAFIFLFAFVISAQSVIPRVERRIEKAFEAGNVEKLMEHMNNKTYVSLPGNKSGYFSNNQLFYILEEFFEKNKIVRCNIKLSNADTGNPFYTGKLRIKSKRLIQTKRLFISLYKSNNKWMFSQITIN